MVVTAKRAGNLSCYGLGTVVGSASELWGRPMKQEILARHFVCYFKWLGWEYIQLGFHVHLRLPNIELHIPFGFCRVGWVGIFKSYSSNCYGYDGLERKFGIMRW